MLFVLGAAVVGLWIYFAFLGASLNRAGDERLHGGTARADRTSPAATGELVSH